MTAARLPRRLLLTLAAVFCALTAAEAARAAGNTSANGALQIAVEVIHPCTVDTASAIGSRSLDVARRETLVLATQSSLAQSCGATQTRVAVYDVRASLLESSAGTVQQLDIEF